MTARIVEGVTPWMQDKGGWGRQGVQSKEVWGRGVEGRGVETGMWREGIWGRGGGDRCVQETRYGGDKGCRGRGCRADNG